MASVFVCFVILYRWNELGGPPDGWPLHDHDLSIFDGAGLCIWTLLCTVRSLNPDQSTWYIAWFRIWWLCLAYDWRFSLSLQMIDRLSITCLWMFVKPWNNMKQHSEFRHSSEMWHDIYHYIYTYTWYHYIYDIIWPLSLEPHPSSGRCSETISAFSPRTDLQTLCASVPCSHCSPNWQR